MKKLETFLSGLIIGGIICIVIFTLTSCSSERYGCGRHGRGKGYSSSSITGWRYNY